MSEAKQTLILLAVPLSFCFTWKALPANSKPPVPSCVNSHANSNTVRACATCMCLPKCKAKKHGHCQQILPRLLTTSWQRKAVWKTSFQTNPQELSTLCIYPIKLLNTTKNVSINKTLAISTLPQCFYPATYEEQPMSNNDAAMFCFGKRGTGKKCINSYTGLREG